MRNQHSTGPEPLQHQVRVARKQRERREWRRDLPFLLVAGIAASRAETLVRADWGASTGIGLLVFFGIGISLYLGVRRLAQWAFPGYFTIKRVPPAT